MGTRVRTTETKKIEINIDRHKDNAKIVAKHEVVTLDSVHVYGREGTNDHINGMYLLDGEHNGKKYYKLTRRQGNLFLYFEPTRNLYGISDVLGGARNMIARCQPPGKDDPINDGKLPPKLED